MDNDTILGMLKRAMERAASEELAEVKVSYTYGLHDYFRRKRRSFAVSIATAPDASFDLCGIRILCSAGCVVQLDAVGMFEGPAHQIIQPCFRYMPTQKIGISCCLLKLSFWNWLKLNLGFVLPIQIVLDGQKVFR